MIIHLHIQARVRRCRHTCIYTCMQAYMHTCIHAYMPTCIHAFLRDASICIRTHTHICNIYYLNIHIYVSIHVSYYASIYVSIIICIYLCTYLFDSIYCLFILSRAVFDLSCFAVVHSSRTCCTAATEPANETREDDWTVSWLH